MEEDEAKANRQHLLKAMESDLVLPFGLADIKMPISEFDCISSVRQCFQARLPFLENIPISFSLPLPQVRVQSFSNIHKFVPISQPVIK